MVVRYFYLVRLVLQLLCVFLSAYGILLFILAADSIPRVIVTSETGRVMEGKPEPFAMSVDNVKPFVSDVLASLYTRTETGRIVSDATPYVDALVIKAIDSAFPSAATIKRMQDAGQPLKPMSVSMVILDVKFRFIRREVLQVSFKTLISSHSEDGGYQSSIVYFDTRWDRSPNASIADNPLGWKLSGIVTSTENLYNKEEILEEIKKNTAIVSDVPLPGGTADATPKASATPTTGIDNSVNISVPSLGNEK